MRRFLLILKKEEAFSLILEYCCARSSLELLWMLCGHEETKMKIKIITLRMPSLAEQKECIQLLKIFFF